MYVYTFRAGVTSAQEALSYATQQAIPLAVLVVGDPWVENVVSQVDELKIFCKYASRRTPDDELGLVVAQCVCKTKVSFHASPKTVIGEFT